MEPYIMTQNDLEEGFWLQLVEQRYTQNAQTGIWAFEEIPLDLSAISTTVSAKFRLINTSTTLQDITCTKILTSVNGWVELTWPADSLDIDVGMYEFQVSASVKSRKLTAVKYYPAENSNDYCEKFLIQVVAEFADVA